MMEAEKVRKKRRFALVARIGTGRSLLELDVGPKVCTGVYRVFIYVYIGVLGPQVYVCVYRVMCIRIYGYAYT